MAVKKPGKNAAYVACGGGCRATADCQFGCVACGVCVSVCPFEAIEMNAFGAAEVIEDKCLGCGRCTRECPRGVIRMHERLNPIIMRCANESPGRQARAMCQVSCIGCGVCEKACPSGAIRVKNNLARLDDSLCLSCGQCLVKCPRGVIYDLRGILHK